MSAKRGSHAPVVISKRSKQFRKMLAELPPPVQKIADGLFEKFEKDPEDPSLGTKSLYDDGRGHHRKGSFSVQVTLRYRAIYVIDNGKDGKGPRQYYWYWIGSREHYSGYVNAR